MHTKIHKKKKKKNVLCKLLTKAIPSAIWPSFGHKQIFRVMDKKDKGEKSS